MASPMFLVLLCLCGASGLSVKPQVATTNVQPAVKGIRALIGRFRGKKEIEAAPQICIGAMLPEVDVQVLPPFATSSSDEDDQIMGILPPCKTVSIGEALGGGKSLLIGMPGAFTPTCTDKHLPGYMRLAETLKETCGVSKISIVTTNDRHVNEAWRIKLAECRPGWDPSMEMICDGDGDLVKALGLVEDMGFGMGARSKRFSLVVEDGVVSHVAVDEGLHTLDATSAESLVRLLKPAGADLDFELGNDQAVGAALVGVLGLAAVAYYAAPDALAGMLN